MENEIILGDAYELIKQVPDKSVDLIVTDPPYAFGNNITARGGFLRNRKNNIYDEIKSKQLSDGIKLSILDELDRVMKKVNIYLWCNKEQILGYLKHYVEEKGCNFEFIIWAKNNPPPFTSGYRYLKDKEYCLYFWEKGVKPKVTCERGKTVYVTSLNTYDKAKYLHPTIKPIEIIENLIKNSSSEGDLVLDPFSGSGTTCAAAKSLGRKWLGFEIDPEYHRISSERLQGWNQCGELNLLDAIGEWEK